MQHPSFHKKRTRRYKFAKRILNLLSVISKDNRYHPNIKIEWTSIQRIGVFCQWGIGDAVLMTPLLIMLRKVSNAKIELIGKSWLRELFMSQDICDHVHICVPPWTKFKKKYFLLQYDWYKYFRQLKSLRKVHFDLLISIRYDPREVVQLKLLNSSIRAAYSACGGRPWLDIDFGDNPSIAKMMHIVYDATVAAEILTKKKANPIPLLKVPAHNINCAAQWLRKNGYRDGVILTISPGAGNLTRRWPDDSYNEVLKDLPKSVGFIVVILSPEENSTVDIRWPLSIPGAFWKGSLIELQGILSITDVLLTSDSGVMHIGAAYGCYIVAIFGPMLKQWFRPYAKQSEIIIVEPMPCRPCFDKCIYEDPICMKNIEEDDVKEAVNRAFRQVIKARAQAFSNKF
jgi:ADP-heptose:LPS heptosyltransferase